MELLKIYWTLSNLHFQNQISLDVEYFVDGCISIVRSIKLETDCLDILDTVMNIIMSGLSEGTDLI